MKFHTDHFPAGTQFRAPLVGDIILTAKTVCSNGPNSYLVHYEQIEGKEKDLCAINIDHVTEIIKRGDGQVVWALEKFKPWSDKYGISKNRYQEFCSLNCIIIGLIHKYANRKEWVVDAEGLTRQLYKENLIRETLDGNGFMYCCSCNKRKLQRAVKRMITHHLCKHNELRREYENECDEEMEHEWAWEHEWALGREHGIGCEIVAG